MNQETSLGSPLGLNPYSAPCQAGAPSLVSPVLASNPIVTAPPPSQLPTETILDILHFALEELHGVSTHTLLSTSIVSRAWSAASQEVLWHRVFVTAKNADRFLAAPHLGKYRIRQAGIWDLAGEKLDNVLTSLKRVERLGLYYVENCTALAHPSMRELKHLTLIAPALCTLSAPIVLPFTLSYLSLQAHVKCSNLFVSLLRSLTFPQSTLILSGTHNYPSSHSTLIQEAFQECAPFLGAFEMDRFMPESEHCFAACDRLKVLRLGREVHLPMLCSIADRLGEEGRVEELSIDVKTTMGVLLALGRQIDSRTRWSGLRKLEVRTERGSSDDPGLIGCEEFRILKGILVQHGIALCA